MTRAVVYKGERPAATLSTEPDGVTAFLYLPDYLASGGPPVATTLPLTDRVRIDRAGAVPPFFAGLLPEGRRLTALRRGLKISADDELALVLAVGSDLVGDVRVIREGTVPAETPALVAIGAEPIVFADLLADTGVIDPVGISGVQDKVSARMITVSATRANERYILKLSPPEYPHVVENEAFFLRFARELRLPVARAEVVRDATGVAGLLVQRFDRVDGQRRAMEDATQVLGTWPANKYDPTSERAVGALIGVCAAPAVAARHFLRQLVFAYLTGNGDVHAKNLSVLASETGEWIASPAYDLPSTVLYGDLTMALEINGEDRDITREDVIAFGDAVMLRPRAVERAVDQLLAATDGLRERFDAARLPFSETQTDALFSELTRRRVLLTD